MICRPKEVGGPGIPNLKLLNVAYMAKLAWRWVNSEALWSRVLSENYGLLGLKVGNNPTTATLTHFGVWQRHARLCRMGWLSSRAIGHSGSWNPPVSSLYLGILVHMGLGTSR